MAARSNGLIRYAARVRRGFAVLGLVLLAASSTPCAMAFDLAHSCPHCPVQAAGHGSSHHGHPGEHGKGGQAGCDSLQGACGDQDQVNTDARPAQPTIRDLTDLPAIAIAAPVDVEFRLSYDRYPSVDPPLRQHAPPAIHLLNCVFLD